MRRAFVSTLASLADQDERVVLLTGDLGFMVIEDFARRHPQRFVNVGVAEANMIAMAAGLAARGMLPFCYSIATFASMRGYDQFRNGAVMQSLPVRVIGVGGGFAYGSSGATHYALEDVGILRLQPGLSVIAPADDAQAATALQATYDLPGPVYYRVGKDPVALPELGGRFRLGELELVGTGKDVALVTSGATTAVVLEAARALHDRGIDATVAVVPSLAPAPLAQLSELASRFDLVTTVEDHYIAGGLGSLVAEVIADGGHGCRLLRQGVESLPDGRTGSETYLRKRAGLSPDAVADAVLRAMPITT